MDEPLKKSAPLAGRREGPRRGRTPAKLRVKLVKPAPVEAPAETRITLPPEAKALIPSTALIGVGLLLESELLVGVALGTGIVIASRWLPQAVGDTVEPIVRSTVQACYTAAAKTSEMLGEAVQRVEGLVTRRATLEEEAPRLP
jgi:hypothetical protein